MRDASCNTVITVRFAGWLFSVSVTSLILPAFEVSLL
jgi:hypothetical protein